MTDEYVWVFIKPGTRDTACIPASVMTGKKRELVRSPNGTTTNFKSHNTVKCHIEEGELANEKKCIAGMANGTTEPNPAL